MKLIYYMHHESHFMCFGKKLIDEAEAPNLYRECFIRVNILRKPISLSPQNSCQLTAVSTGAQGSEKANTHACMGEEVITVLAEVSLQ